jgi:hypothetical protein
MTTMPRSVKARESLQPGLFEQGQPDVVLSPTRTQQLATMIEALLLEIAAALAIREVGDDQDYR